jgi:hypothetical protein
LKSGIEAADKAARRAVKDGGKKLTDATKAMNKARRLANRALDFEEDDEVSSDYEILMSASGATEKSINMNSTYTQIFAVPAGSSFVWKVRVKKNDIGFAVREIREIDSSVIDIEPLIRYTSSVPIQGKN